MFSPMTQSKPTTAFVSSAPTLLSAQHSLLLGRSSLCSTTAPTEVWSSRPRRARVSMGLFGLGIGEIAVIAGVGILFFGPSKIADMGKDLGGIAGGVKKATAEFKEAMEDSIEQADKEIEEKRIKKEESTSPDTITTTATPATTTTVASTSVSEVDSKTSDAASAKE